MKLSSIIAPLIAAKVAHEIIMQTVEAWEAEQNDALEKRRANDRERQERRRHVKSRDVTVTVSSCTRGEDNLQPKKISGEEKKEKERSPKKATRLPENWELPSDWREEAVKAGLPSQRVEAEARKMVNWSRSSKAGAKLDWHAAWRNWFQRQIEESPPQQRASSPPPRKPNAFDAYEDIARERGWITDEPTILPSDNNDAECVSAVGGRHSGTIVDLRPGAFRRFRSSN